MTTRAASVLGAPSPCGTPWDTINWRPIERQVRRLQMRIAKAVREGRWGKVNALQWLLTHSFSAKLLAVKRVVHNPGRRTPGVRLGEAVAAAGALIAVGSPGGRSNELTGNGFVQLLQWLGQ